MSYLFTKQGRYENRLRETIKDRLKKVKNIDTDYPREYPIAPLKEWIEQDATWEQLFDPKEYTRLLLETTHVRLPDETLLFTIEYLGDRDIEFAGQIINELGLTRLLPAPLDTVVDLLWYFYLTGAPLITTPEETAYISGLDAERLWSLVNHVRGGKRYSEYSPRYLPDLMFTALTGHVINGRGANLSVGVREIKDVRFKLNPQTNRLEYVPKYLERMPTFLSYGLMIYRVIIYLSGHNHPMFKIRYGSMNLFRNSPYDMLFLWEKGNTLQNIIPPATEPFTTKPFSTIPFILTYYRDFNTPLPIVTEGGEFPKELKNLIAGYVVGDNVALLADLLGMVFPSNADTPGRQTNYYWWNLVGYTDLNEERKSLGIDPFPVLPPEQNTWENLIAYRATQDEMLSNYLAPEEGKIRYEVIKFLPDPFILARAATPIPDWKDRQELFHLYYLSFVWPELDLVPVDRKDSLFREQKFPEGDLLWSRNQGFLLVFGRSTDFKRLELLPTGWKWVGGKLEATTPSEEDHLKELGVYYPKGYIGMIY